MARTVQVVKADGETRYKVRYRSAGTETSRTFRRQSDAEMFRDILGNGRDGRVDEAERWLAEKESHREATITFGDYFATWADELTGIAPRTRADYRAMKRRYLTDLDSLPLTLITRGHVARLVNKLEAQGLSPKTIKHAANMLSTVMATALDDGLITRNPVKRVTLPKVRRKADDEEVRFLTYDEAGALIAAIRPHYRPLVAFLFGTGLRWSEATAAQVRHVDLVNGTVRVERAWKRIPGGWEIGPPKSEKSNRTVNAAVLGLLAAHHAAQGRKPKDLLFTTESGGVVRHANFYNRIWKPACIEAGWDDPRPTIHDCRSTFASWLVSDGIPLEAVQDQLGHESYETTRKAYAHLLPSVGITVGRAASAALERALATQNVDLGIRSLEAATDPDEGT